MSLPINNNPYLLGYGLYYDPDKSPSLAKLAVDNFPPSFDKVTNTINSLLLPDLNLYIPKTLNRLNLKNIFPNLKNSILNNTETWNLGMDVANSAFTTLFGLKSEYNGDKGNITLGIDSAYDTISSAARSFGPVGLLVSLGMGAGKLVGNVANKLGAGTDGMTTLDSILGSSLFNWNVGLVNGAFGKRADSFTKDTLAFETVGSSYSGSNYLADLALAKSNKKYGLFSSSERNAANEEIQNAKLLQSRINDIAGLTLDRYALRDSMTAINANKRAMLLLGGYNQSAVRVGKEGIKVEEKLLKDFLPYSEVGELSLQDFLSTLESEVQETNILDFLKNISSEVIEVSVKDVLKKIKRKLKPDYEDWIKTVPKGRISKLYDLELAYEKLPFYELELWRTATNKLLKNGEYHLPSCIEIEDGIIAFLKKGLEDPNKPDYNPEVRMGLDQWFDPNEHGWYDYGRANYDLIYKEGRYWYIPKELTEEFTVDKFKVGGKFNVIPEGALHARLHHMDNDNITKKGIPVVDKDNVLLAEIEREEIIIRLDITKKLEELLKEYYDENTSNSRKDELAIEAGKVLVDEILNNTIDNTNKLL